MSAEVVVESGAALAELLRSARLPRLRLCGRASRSHRVPEPPSGTTTVALRRLDRIDRLEPDDLTCSVEAGVPCAVLEAALQERRVELGCLGGGDGTIGGLFATDPVGAANVGEPSPRSVLLGLEAVLADGTRFRSGARVVKSVAGFDVHRLFVGSRGRLFAATMLHLKLRPLPPAQVDFAVRPAALQTALRRFLDLRRLAPAPARLTLSRFRDGFVVAGRLRGRARWIAATMRAQELDEGEAAPPLLPAAPPGHEIVSGTLRPSRIAALVEALPPDAALVVHGGGRFEACAVPAVIDRLLAVLPGLGATGMVTSGGSARAGLATPLDPGAARLQHALTTELDPAARLA